jgi:hypothetical protein
MDRRQMIVQRAHELFGERVDDVLHGLRQDRQELRGWQEPAHVRAVVRRTVREGEVGGPGPDGPDAVAELELNRAAGEPDRGQQREAVGQLLEAGAAALEKVVRGAAADLTPEEAAGLECVLLLYGRPALLVSDAGRLAGVPPLWNLLEDQREEIEATQRGVGRVELLGHPEYDWAGTGFLVGDELLLTTRRVAETFAERRAEGWQFRPGISAWMNYRSAYQQVAAAGYRVRAVVGVHDRYDVALLEVERPHADGRAPSPLALAAAAPAGAEGRPVYLVGYPVRDARRNEPEAVARVFRDVYNVKRVMPGQLCGTLSFGEVQLLRHDAAPLGRTAGSPLLDLETHRVLGVQTAGRYLEGGTAVPLYVLRDDPLLRRAGVTFAEATAGERQSAAAQLERLARTRYWAEARAAVEALHKRAFGDRPDGER